MEILSDFDDEILLKFDIAEIIEVHSILHDQMENLTGKRKA